MRDERDAFREPIRDPHDASLRSEAREQWRETQPVPVPERVEAATFSAPESVASASMPVSELELDLDVIRRELQPGEMLLWNGSGSHFRMGWGSVPVVIFGMMFFGFAVFWTVMAFGGMSRAASGGGMPSFLRFLCPLWGVPFMLVGLGVMTSPVWAKLKARKTLYALTNRRAIIFEKAMFGSSRQVHSYDPRALGAMTRVDRSDGSGDLVFEEKITGRGKGGHAITKKVGFIGVPDVRGVERAVRDALLN